MQSEQNRLRCWAMHKRCIAGSGKLKKSSCFRGTNGVAIHRIRNISIVPTIISPAVGIIVLKKESDCLNMLQDIHFWKPWKKVLPTWWTTSGLKNQHKEHSKIPSASQQQPDSPLLHTS